MSLKRGDFFVSVVVEHSELEIVGSTDEPVFASDELYTPYWYFCDFKSFDKGAGFMIVDVDCSIVQPC